MINLNDAIPAAPSGTTNVKWQSDVSGNASAYVGFGGSPAPVTSTPVAGVLLLDATTSNNFLVPLTANITSSSVIPGPNGEIITIMWQQNVTGGWTVVMPTNFVGAVTPSTASTAVTIQQFRYNTADGNWYAVGSTVSVDVPHSIPGCALWLSADNIVGLVDGNSVNTWPDPVSGQVGSFIGTAPIYKTPILNGKPIVRFNSTGSLSARAPLDGDQFSIFIVAMASSLTNAYSSLVGFGGNVAQLGAYYIKSSGRTAFYNNAISAYDGSGAFTAVTGTYYVFSAVLGAAGALVTRAALATDASATSSIDANYAGTHILVGGQFVGVSQYLAGDIAELIIYNNGLTVTNRNIIENYLKVKYGL